MSTDAPTSPLAGVTVVEVTPDVHVQFAGRTLRGLGADVTVVEPAGGLPSRSLAPVVPALDGCHRSVPFEYLNGGKRSRVLPGSGDDRQEIVGACTGADIVLLGGSRWPSLAGRLDAPVVVVSSLYGISSPRTAANVPSTEFTRYHAGGDGYFLPTSLDHVLRPTVPGYLVGETFAGAGIAAAALHGLNRFGAHDDQQVIDFCHQAFLVTLNKMFVSQSAYYRASLDRFTHTYPFGGNVACRDGYIAMLVLEQHQWHGLCRMMGEHGWISDPRFADGVLRRGHREFLDERVRAWCAQRSTAEVIAAGRAHDVPIGLVARPSDVLANTGLRRRSFLRPTHTAFGTLDLPGLPYGPDFPPAPDDLVAPAPGQSPPETATRAAAPVHPLGAARDGRRLRVLDLTWAGAGPVITWTLAALGAEVAKVEHPDRPDLLRRANKTYGWSDDDDLDASPAFNEMNANKLSVVLDLRTEEGRSIALRLAATADVVCESMRPGRVERLGLGYEAVKAVNPAVVYCSLSATGRGTGSAEDIPGYAPVFWAEGGGAWLSGWPAASPDYVRSPVDMHAGVMASTGILAALHRRRFHNEGARLDLAAIEAVAVAVGDAVMEAGIGLVERERRGNAAPGRELNDVFRCAGTEQWVAISARDVHELMSVADVLGLDRGAVAAERGGPDLYNLVSAATAERSASEVEAALLVAGVPASRVNSLLQLIDDPDLEERGYWRDVPHPKLDVQRLSTLPWLVCGEARREHRSAPMLDADTDDVLSRWIGLGAEQIAAARRSGAVGGARPRDVEPAGAPENVGGAA